MSPYFCVIGFRKKGRLIFLSVLFGADDEARTRYLHLGKVALYQMSYIRIVPTQCLFIINTKRSLVKSRPAKKSHRKVRRFCLLSSLLPGREL